MSTRRTIRRSILVLILAALAVYGVVRLDNWYTRSQAEKQRDADVEAAGGESGSNGAGSTTEGGGQPPVEPEASGTP